jgi:hypothetical protein
MAHRKRPSGINHTMMYWCDVLCLTDNFSFAHPPILVPACHSIWHYYVLKLYSQSILQSLLDLLYLGVKFHLGNELNRFREAVSGFSAMILVKPLCDNHSVEYSATQSHTLNYIAVHKLEEALD